MKNVQDLLFSILVKLNKHDYKKVRKLAKKTKLRYEIIGCNCIESVVFKGEGYYIAYNRDKEIGFYRIKVSDPKYDLFNTIPQLLVNEAFSTNPVSERKITRFKSQKIIVLLDASTKSGVPTILEKAQEVFHIDMEVVPIKASNVYSITETFIKRGYQYFVAPASSDNLLAIESLISSHPDVKFISPMSTYAEFTYPNLYRLNVDNYQYSNAISYFFGYNPYLILSDDTTNSLDLANKIASLVPGSVVQIIRKNNYLFDTQAAIRSNPSLKRVFFSFSDFGQEYFDAIGDTFSMDYTFYTNDTLQLKYLQWSRSILAFKPGYLPTVLQLDYFGTGNKFIYLYVESLFYFQSYILEGYRALSGVTGVIEWDSFNDRIWISYEMVQYIPDSVSSWSTIDYKILNPLRLKE